jgi:hypothetical protein
MTLSVTKADRRTFAQYPAWVRPRVASYKSRPGVLFFHERPILGLGRPAWLDRSCRGGGLALAMGEEPNARARPSFEQSDEGENPR